MKNEEQMIYEMGKDFYSLIPDDDVNERDCMYAAVEMFAKGYRKQEWISVEERLPDKAGEYLVVYHPCYWDNVYEEVRVGLDTFRGKTSWAKRKFQRVTHWMPLPEPPKMKGG